MTGALAGPYVASAAVLGLAGVAKAVRPADTAGALRAAGLTGRSLATRAQHAAVRAGALAEVAIAGAALAAPGPVPAALVAASYAAFAAFVTLALVRGWPLSSCGCFGKPDTPPTRSHAALNAVATVCALWWAASAPSNLIRTLARQNWHGSALILEAAVVALLAFVVWTNPLPAASGRS